MMRDSKVVLFRMRCLIASIILMTLLIAIGYVYCNVTSV
jgi:hypothetical protein